MRYLLLFLAAPGSFALLAIALRELVKAVRNYRAHKEDTDRRDRIALEYSVPCWAVADLPEPTGRVVEPEPKPMPRNELPEITSRYREEVERG